MNYLVISPMPNGNYLVQLMNENQFTALKKAGVIDEGSSIYSTEMDHQTVAQSGLIGMHTVAEINQYIKENDIDIVHIEGPPLGDDTGGTD